MSYDYLQRKPYSVAPQFGNYAARLLISEN